ncbi:hypothetical protein EYF80_041905 [Liparis tanakae]|uniref:Uncharacterized protein n=1 Tax=Liparis tanakae TaxID=230148 RepID=A0A4Z2G539_9TELE|nr:hypothetical protein EYF80_041905 [Liparis tanakae]
MRLHPPGAENIDRKRSKDPGDRLGGSFTYFWRRGSTPRRRGSEREASDSFSDNLSQNTGEALGSPSGPEAWEWFSVVKRRVGAGIFLFYPKNTQVFEMRAPEEWHHKQPSTPHHRLFHPSGPNELNTGKVFEERRFSPSPPPPSHGHPAQR